MGLTRSYRSKKDRRVRKVTLTEKGLEMVEKSLPLRYLTLSEITSCFNEEEIKIFSGYIQRISNQMGRLSGQAAVAVNSEPHIDKHDAFQE